MVFISAQYFYVLNSYFGSSHCNDNGLRYWLVKKREKLGFYMRPSRHIFTFLVMSKNKKQIDYFSVHIFY